MASEPIGPEESPPPPAQLATWTLLGLLLVAVVALISFRSEHQPDTTRDYGSRILPPEPEPVLLPSKPMDDAYVPCSDCHGEEDPVDRTRRELVEEHEDKKLAHGDLWCLHCHDAKKRDMLHLADQLLVGFDESWRLCTQCHGRKLGEWRAGVHGKRMGHWWGPKEYWTCVSCHNPHSPSYQPLEPKPPPLPPKVIAADGRGTAEASHEKH